MVRRDLASLSLSTKRSRFSQPYFRKSVQETLEDQLDLLELPLAAEVEIGVSILAFFGDGGSHLLF
jgi:hypothetical protein